MLLARIAADQGHDLWCSLRCVPCQDHVSWQTCNLDTSIHLSGTNLGCFLLLTGVQALLQCSCTGGCDNCCGVQAATDGWQVRGGRASARAGPKDCGQHAHSHPQSRCLLFLFCAVMICHVSCRVKGSCGRIVCVTPWLSKRGTAYLICQSLLDSSAISSDQSGGAYSALDVLMCCLPVRTFLTGVYCVD